MNKTHTIILTVGLAGCLLLTMMMGHLLKMNPAQHAGGPIAERFASRFQSKLEKPAYLVLKQPEPEKDGPAPEPGVHVVAKIQPKPTTDIDRLVMDMGAFLWSQKFEGPLLSVIVRWRDPKTGEVTRSRVRRPGQRKSLKLYGSK